MADLKRVQNKKIPILWVNFNAGVLGSTSTVNVQAGVNSINQAFKQSPFLKIN
jgi:hypothetical protein